MQIDKLGDLVNITIGRTPSRSNNDFWDKDRQTDNVWLSIADLINVDGRTVSDSKEYITDIAARSFDIIPRGTLLVSFKLTLGRLAFAGRDLRTNEAIAALRNDESKVLNDYLYYFLSYFDWMAYASGDKKVKGFTLNKAKLSEIKIVYPDSIDEQRRIVSKLDVAFGKINQSIKLTENSLALSSALRSSLIEKYMSEESAEPIHLGDFCKFENGDRGKNYPSKSKQIASGIPFINAGNLNRSKIDFNGMAYISQATFDSLGGGKIRRNDILFCLRGSLGKFASVGDLSTGAIASSLVIIRPDTDRALTDYLLYYFEGEQCGRMIRKFENGAAQPNLSGGSLKKFEINLPDVKRQARVVELLNMATDKIDTVTELRKKKLQSLHLLKHSMLSQAFSESAVK